VLLDYAEQKGLVYMWAYTQRERVLSPAFIAREHLISPQLLAFVFSNLQLRGKGRVVCGASAHEPISQREGTGESADIVRRVGPSGAVT
jgi:hypothetical protein